MSAHVTAIVKARFAAQLSQRLQSVFNASAHVVFSARKSEHITPHLRELHWLKVPQRIQFRLCVLMYRCLNSTAPSYLAETLHNADLGSRRGLRSASTSTLVIPSTRHTTLGDRAFPVAAARSNNRMTYHQRKGRGYGHVTVLKFCRLS